jgi:hypothetical protein
MIELQQIASNLQDTFTDYKGVTKYLNPTVNMPYRVEVPIKTTHPLKRGRASQQGGASNKCPKTTRMKSSSNTVNPSQLQVDGLREDDVHPQASPQVCTIEAIGTSKDPDSLVLRNHDEFHGIQEISINYTSSQELFDRNTTVVNSCFSTIVADLLNDPELNTMTECKQSSDWIKWMEAIKAKLDSPKRREVFSNVISTPPRVHPIRFK